MIWRMYDQNRNLGSSDDLVEEEDDHSRSSEEESLCISKTHHRWIEQHYSDHHPNVSSAIYIIKIKTFEMSRTIY